MFGLLSLILLKHYLCDFVLQFPFQYMNKGIYGHLGGISHAVCHMVGTLFVCVIFELSPLLALADGIIHYHIDWVKKNIDDYFNLKPERKLYWNVLGADQLLHGLTYLLLFTL